MKEMTLKDIDFEYEDSPFDEEYCFEYRGSVYEYLDQEHFPKHRFRVIFSDDDYDYVEDEALVERMMRYLVRCTKLDF